MPEHLGNQPTAISPGQQHLTYTKQQLLAIRAQMAQQNRLAPPQGFNPYVVGVLPPSSHGG